MFDKQAYRELLFQAINHDISLDLKIILSYSVRSYRSVLQLKDNPFNGLDTDIMD